MIDDIALGDMPGSSCHCESQGPGPELIGAGPGERNASTLPGGDELGSWRGEEDEGDGGRWQGRAYGRGSGGERRGKTSRTSVVAVNRGSQPRSRSQSSLDGRRAWGWRQFSLSTTMLSRMSSLGCGQVCRRCFSSKQVG